MQPIQIIEADLNDRSHQQMVVDLVDAYSQDPMGNGRPLEPDVRRNLVQRLQKHPTTMIFLALDGDQGVGIAVCFLGFSTFRAQPLINIHDLAVIPGYRGAGIGSKLIEAVADKARSLNCCKLTLEVQENNLRARKVYESAGFRQAVYENEAGGALFMSRLI
ncbi:GNAT family N-acetyltransferase [bacterium]|nr:GNAT family N-acetyltransferase [bacterium]